MTFNTNRLRKIGNKLEQAWLGGEPARAYISLADITDLSLAAAELDALRTECNLARAEREKSKPAEREYCPNCAALVYLRPFVGTDAGVGQNAFCSVFGSSDPHMALLKIEAAAIGVNTDFLEDLERLKQSFGGPRGDLLAKELLDLLMRKERADIRRMLPDDPGG